jgi:SNF2 family DNA or RNA helicase
MSFSEKTLQSIGLILANPPVGRNGKSYPYKKPKGPADPRATLIVGPVSVLANWKIE